MNKINLIIVILLSLVVITLLFYMYVFKIYEVVVEKNTDILFADHQSVAEIQVVPVNAFGWKVPFRSSPADFNIKEGADLIDIIEEDNENGILKIRVRDKIGIVAIEIKSKYSTLPMVVEIPIILNIAIK